jgi:hypothetical protein
MTGLAQTAGVAAGSAVGAAATASPVGLGLELAVALAQLLLTAPVQDALKRFVDENNVSKQQQLANIDAAPRPGEPTP